MIMVLCLFILPSFLNYFAGLVQGTKCTKGFSSAHLFSIYWDIFMVISFLAAVKTADGDKPGLIQLPCSPFWLLHLCLLCSAANHAGDNWHHQTAGGEDLRSRWVLVSVCRLEHHRNPEKPKSIHQDCLWVHFKMITVSLQMQTLPNKVYAYCMAVCNKRILARWFFSLGGWGGT